ncbi:MAG TPA: hypothetical protein VFN11_22595 [Ktedonobacterales bacterium]|nr:hypothetical protein [Ktedonobacterales bacterium]
MAVQNISLGAQLRLPFNGDRTRLRLNFAERHHPFMLAVALFGGGGYVMLDCGLDGIDALEASLDFGGDLSFDIGVASGGVSVVAGITYTKDASQVSFTGSDKAGGALEVLDMICISVEFYMSLTYETTSSRVWGQATVSVEVDIGFFSKSVDLTMERDFAASPPPTFGDIMRLASPADPASALTDWDASGNPIPSLSDWATYCAAFASIGGAA